jgi:hypothetical protein
MLFSRWCLLEKAADERTTSMIALDEPLQLSRM